MFAKELYLPIFNRGSSININDSSLWLKKRTSLNLIANIQEGSSLFIDQEHLEILRLLDSLPSGRSIELLEDKDSFTSTALKNYLENFIAQSTRLERISGNSIVLAGPNLIRYFRDFHLRSSKGICYNLEKTDLATRAKKFDTSYFKTINDDVFEFLSSFKGEISVLDLDLMFSLTDNNLQRVLKVLDNLKFANKIFFRLTFSRKNLQEKNYPQNTILRLAEIESWFDRKFTLRTQKINTRTLACPVTYYWLIGYKK